MSEWTARSPEETRSVGAALAERLAPDGTLLLCGDLGAGKTVLAQGVGRGLGLDPEQVQSPSYVLIREHLGAGEAGDAADPPAAAVRMIHVDLYRLSADEVWGLGLEEILAGPGVKVVEWADRLPFPVAGALRLRIDRLDDGRRRLQLEQRVEKSRPDVSPTNQKPTKIAD